MLEGRNFPLNLGGQLGLYGFFTTRRVKAASPEEAELAAIALIRKDRSLLDAIDGVESSNPEIFLDGIYKLNFWSRLGGAGYSFYPMESS